jgi:glutaminase
MTFEHVSTGRLPSAGEVQALIDDTYERFRAVDDGANSDVYPALERADRSHFGLSVVGPAGSAFEAGDVHVPFTIMSVAKPFVFALVCEAIGASEVHRLIGVNATGLPFNSLEAVERSAGGRTNPMVNSGAIATTGLVPGASGEEKWSVVRDGLSRFAGRELTVDEEVFASASATNHRNQAIARLLDAMGAISADPSETVDCYTRQSCLSVTAHDLAVMGATLASGGVNPVTGERVVRADTCHDVLTVMAIAGLYETSGDWLFDVGVPGKSGIGGGIVTVSPGKGGLGTYSPPLDAAGNSVRGQLAARHLSRALGLDLFVSSSPG